MKSIYRNLLWFAVCLMCVGCTTETEYFSDEYEGYQYVIPHRAGVFKYGMDARNTVMTYLFALHEQDWDTLYRIDPHSNFLTINEFQALYESDVEQLTTLLVDLEPSILSDAIDYYAIRFFDIDERLNGLFIDLDDARSHRFPAEIDQQGTLGRGAGRLKFANGEEAHFQFSTVLLPDERLPHLYQLKIYERERTERCDQTVSNERPTDVIVLCNIRLIYPDELPNDSYTRLVSIDYSYFGQLPTELCLHLDPQDYGDEVGEIQYPAPEVATPCVRAHRHGTFTVYNRSLQFPGLTPTYSTSPREIIVGESTETVEGVIRYTPIHQQMIEYEDGEWR